MKRLWILILCLALFLLPACGGKNEEGTISALTFDQSYDLTEELTVGQKSENGYFTVVTTAETYFWDIEFVSTDESVATVRYEKTASDIYVYYTIEAIAAGETYVYFTAADGKVESPRIKVTVTEKATGGTPEDTEPEETEPEIEVSGDDRVVYVTKTGKKYHYSKSCAGETATAMKRSEACLTREPCKTCVPEEDRVETSDTTAPDTTEPPSEDTTEPNGETTEPESDTVAPEDTTEPADTTASKVVYVTPSGKRYHYKQSCAGKNAIETTLEKAIADGKTPCGTCAKE